MMVRARDAVGMIYEGSRVIKVHDMHHKVRMTLADGRTKLMGDSTWIQVEDPLKELVELMEELGLYD